MPFRRSLIIRSKQMLPTDYIPSSFDVICARGADAFRHNLRFRRTIKMHMSRYAAASTQLDQDEVVDRIIDSVRRQSINGGFIRQDPSTGLYFEVGDFHAREKVSQLLNEGVRKNGLNSRRKYGSKLTSELPSVDQESIEIPSLCDEESDDEAILAPPTLNYQSSSSCISTSSFEPSQFRMSKCSQSLMDDDDDDDCSDVEDFFNIRRLSSSSLDINNNCHTLLSS